MFHKITDICLLLYIYLWYCTTELNSCRKAHLKFLDLSLQLSNQALFFLEFGVKVLDLIVLPATDQNYLLRLESCNTSVHTLISGVGKQKLIPMRYDKNIYIIRF